MTQTDSETLGNTSLPLCVDLDGTLIQTDSLWESCLRLISQHPFMVLLLPFWLFLGKAGFKHKVAQKVNLDPASLPFNTSLLKYLTQQRLHNRHIVLVTAANKKIAETIAHHLKIFDEILASDGTHNLSGTNKAKLLCEKFGEKGFVYAGNANIDLNVWRHAAAAIVVNASDALAAKAQQVTTIEASYPSIQKPSLKIILKAMRIHQWAKNLLIFTALILSHNLFNNNALQLSVFAFLSFGFAASAIYLFNDLIDLEADRNHKRKKHRPLAAGTLSIQWAVIIIPLLLILSYAFAWQTNPDFIVVLSVYLLLTTAYSLYLKPIALLDVITLTSLYTIRIIAGAVAIAVPLSYWLLAFSMFIFLSLALIKRFSELKNLTQQGETKSVSRDYHIDDLPAVSLFGISSGYISIMVLVFYIHDLQADKLYSQPDWLWFVAITILYWISRMWLLAFRGNMNEDPVLFAIRDRTSYIVSLIVMISLYLAL
ncbi:MAG: UbiA family prenyltransferase [Gammaproteobacteria bacterium]|nr:UbiA family prenyltransferase [Gammaproteobacteria bacterium]MCW8986443.1 UbiA family prenyltransferase [Gammaproteobacteria bacterium]MCW9032433.1 UbiA family prenyltransferase [Gammaproteobacteria bacterium]